jgi:succinate dehydrogenase / fumarate reductase cytochrome b subunit
MSSASTAQATRRPADAGFLRSRLGSLLAVIPLGVWTVFHLVNNLSAFRGASAWQTDVTEYKNPLVFFASGLVSFLPLVLHTVWGIGRLVSFKPNNVKYMYFANVRFALQRLSAVGVLFFLGAHVWLAMLHPRLTTGRAEAFADIAHQMHHHVPTLVVYLLGTLGVAYHLANGLQSFAMGWGLVVSRRALRRLDSAVVLLFVVLLAMSWGAIYALWDAGA